MDLETAQTSTTTKLPILKQGEYDMWRLKIEQYFQVQDYALWDVIENGNSFIPVAQTITNADGLFSPPKLDLSNYGIEEFQQPKFEGYGPKTSKSVSKDISNEVKESPDAPLVKELVLDDKLEKKTVFSTGHSQKEDQGYVDSGCSRHMTGSMSCLSDFKEFDGGYVTFGGGSKGERITGKGTLKTGKLNFEHVYFVKELKFNLLSVSQMCDKKNSVLFTDTRCFVLSLDFKLADESQVLLKVPRKNNMYSVYMKNIVPKESLTCLVAKATLDESMLWHRRLGHVNFNTINKLVKKNLVRGLPQYILKMTKLVLLALKERNTKPLGFGIVLLGKEEELEVDGNTNFRDCFKQCSRSDDRILQRFMRISSLSLSAAAIC
nr:ribonuclease H-like domain-containing protein [Tanacetum cinerariifolium]